MPSKDFVGLRSFAHTMPHLIIILRAVLRRLFLICEHKRKISFLQVCIVDMFYKYLPQRNSFLKSTSHAANLVNAVVPRHKIVLTAPTIVVRLYFGLKGKIFTIIRKRLSFYSLYQSRHKRKNRCLIIPISVRLCHIYMNLMRRKSEHFSLNKIFGSSYSSHKHRKSDPRKTLCFN